MTPKRPFPETLHVVGAAIIDAGGRLMAAQRGEAMSSAGRWELPGGKIETGEAPEAALVREIREELGLEIEVGRFVGRGRATGTRYRIDLDVFAATAVGGSLTLHEHAEIRWLAPDDLESVEWADADRPLLPALRRLLDTRSVREPL